MNLYNSLHMKAKRKAAELLFHGDKVSPEVVKMRVDRCSNGCKYFDPVKEECVKCTCVLSVKWKLHNFFHPLKLRNEIAHCPIGRWDDLELANYYNLIDEKKIIKDDQENV